MATSKFITINGLRLHYLDHSSAGSAALPPLVCIHGLTGNAHSFDALAPLLATRYRPISIDVRGRGDSQWGPPAEYAFPNYIGDLTALLDALGFARVTLIGTSMGGIISMMFAGGYPDRVERVVLNDIGPDIDPAGLERIRSYVGEAPSEFADMTEVVAYFRATYPPMARLSDVAAEQWVKWSVKPTSGGKLTWKMDPAVRRVIPGSPGARPIDLWMPYCRIAAPILIVRGGDSDILSRATAERMCHAQPRARVVEVAGVGHAPSLGEPESLAALRDFLML